MNGNATTAALEFTICQDDLRRPQIALPTKKSMAGRVLTRQRMDCLMNQVAFQIATM